MYQGILSVLPILILFRVADAILSPFIEKHLFFSSSLAGFPVSLNINLSLARELEEDEVIIVGLPRFTRTISYTQDTAPILITISGLYGEIINDTDHQLPVSPSTYFEASWVSQTQY